MGIINQGNHYRMESKLKRSSWIRKTKRSTYPQEGTPDFISSYPRSSLRSSARSNLRPLDKPRTFVSELPRILKDINTLRFRESSASPLTLRIPTERGRALDS